MTKDKAKQGKHPKVSIVRSLATVSALLILSPIILYVTINIAMLVTELVAPESTLMICGVFFVQIYLLYRLGMWLAKRRYENSPMVQEQRRLQQIMSTEKMLHRLADEEHPNDNQFDTDAASQTLSSEDT